VAPRTKASIEIDVKGLKAVNELLNKLNAINTNVNKINKAVGPVGRKDQLSDQQKLETQINRLQTKSLRIRNQLVNLNNKDKKIQTIKARLTRAENKAAVGKFTAANRELAIAEKELVTQKLTTAEIAKQAKESARMTAIRQGNFAGSGPGVFGPQPRPSFAQSIGIKRGFDFQSAAISGAFPLLFGQGPVASIAGGLGGGVGGMFGGMGGFAGGIAATAAVQTISNIVGGITELGKALSTLDGTFSLLKEKSLFSSKEAATRAQILQTLGEREKLASLLSEELIKVLGEDGAQDLREAAKVSEELNTELTKISLTLQIALAGPLKNVLKFINALIEQGNKVSLGEGKGTVNLGPKEDQFIKDFRGVLETFNQSQLDRILRAPIGTNVEGLNVTEASKQAIRKFSLVKQVNPDSPFVGGSGTEGATGKELLDIDAARVASAQKKINKMQEEIKFAQQIKTLGLEEATIQKEIEAITKNLNAEELKLLETGELNIRALIEKNKEAKEFEQNAININAAFESLSDSINNDIKEGIKGLIKGTSTLGDMLNNIADKFLDLALNQGLFGSILGSAGKPGGGLLGALGLFANGGRPPVGKPSIVGEKGPELFVPRSSGTIVPNNKLGGGGTNNVVVNVDASGSDVQGDDAGGQELGSLIAAAVQGELVKQQRPGGLLNR